MARLSAPPFETELESQAPATQGGTERSGFISEEWLTWLRSVTTRVEASPQRLVATRLPNQSASLGATALPLPTLAAGLYRITVRARITQVATVSSSLTIAINWTDTAVACAQGPAAMTGNTLATVNDPFSILIRIDEGTSIRYTTTYASVGATPMKYDVEFTVEQVSA